MQNLRKTTLDIHDKLAVKAEIEALEAIYRKLVEGTVLLGANADIRAFARANNHRMVRHYTRDILIHAAKGWWLAQKGYTGRGNSYDRRDEYLAYLAEDGRDETSGFHIHELEPVHVTYWATYYSGWPAAVRLMWAYLKPHGISRVR